jgi:hypothetical protein
MSNSTKPKAKKVQPKAWTEEFVKKYKPALKELAKK